MNHTEKCRSRFQEIFIKSGDPRLRKAERMGYGETEKTEREIPTRTDMEVTEEETRDEEMKEESEQEEEGKDTEMYMIGPEDRMLMSLSPDEDVRERVRKIEMNVNKQEECQMELRYTINA